MAIKPIWKNRTNIRAEKVADGHWQVLYEEPRPSGQGNAVGAPHPAFGPWETEAEVIAAVTEVPPPAPPLTEAQKDNIAQAKATRMYDNPQDLDDAMLMQIDIMKSMVSTENPGAPEDQLRTAVIQRIASAIRPRLG